MPHITKRTFSSLLFAGILICVSYVAAQRSPSQQPRGTQGAKPQSTQETPQQQTDQLRDQLLQLQMEVKDLQAAISNLSSEQRVTGATVKETHELLLDSQLVQTQNRQDLNSLIRTVGQDEKQLDKLGQQVSSMILDLRRVKTKVGLY
jgi:septal ring factor EnvC (AmiA/AmiB activator)